MLTKLKNYLKQKRHKQEGITDIHEYSKMDKTVLEANIRKTAHILDKGIYNDENYNISNWYLEKRSQLLDMIQVWNEKNYPKDEPTIIWANEILKNFEEGCEK